MSSCFYPCTYWEYRCNFNYFTTNFSLNSDISIFCLYILNLSPAFTLGMLFSVIMKKLLITHDSYA